MACKHAIISEVTSFKPGMKIAEAMESLEEHHIRTAPVIDENGKLLGMFGYHTLLMGLLPVSVTMEDGLQRLDFVIGAAPTIARKLKKIKDKTIETAMDEKPYVVHPLMPIWEAIRILVKHGSPIPVVEEKTGTFIGLITEQSALAEMEKSEEELEGQIEEELRDREAK